MIGEVMMFHFNSKASGIEDVKLYLMCDLLQQLLYVMLGFA